MRSIAFLLALVGLVALAGCSTPAPEPVAAPAPAPIVIGTDDLRLPAGLPALRAGDVPSFPVFAEAVVNMTESGSHRETSLAVSPVDRSLVFACDPSGVPNISGGHSYYYISRDNGTTWSDLQIETEMTDPRQFTFEGGDCDVAIDAAGTLYSADSWLGSIAVGSSKDGGIHWDVGQPAAGSGPVADRPWLVGGVAGTVYLTYQDVQFGMPSVIWFTMSTDYGLTFLPAVPVATAAADGAYTWTGNLEVSGDGQDMYSVYTRQAGATHNVGGAPESVWVAASHDGGLTWTSNKVSDRPAAASYLYPSIGLDDGGQLHVVFSQADQDGQPIWYSTSTDQAATWSEPVALAPGTTGYSPWIAGGQAGQALAIWYGSPNPKALFNADEDWYLYWARMDNGTILTGTTTAEPVFQGKQAVGFAEFNMVRLDADGIAHIGASIAQGDGNDVHWQAVYQRQVLGPST